MFPIRSLKPRPRLPLAAVTLGIAFATLTTATAGIITVTATAGPGLPSLVDDTGSAIPAGNEVQLGFFDIGFDFQATNNLDTLQRNWTSFGSLGVGDIFGQAGSFSGDLQGDDLKYWGKQIYLFAFLTSGNEAPQSNWNNVEDYGIFTNPAWTFPSSDSGTPFTMVSTADATSMSGGIQLTGIPEPSTAGVCGVILGASILCARRRSPRRRVPGTTSFHPKSTPAS